MRLSVLRSFARDPLLARTTMPDDQRSHPVVQAILRRRAEGSRPGERTDRRRIALVIEGGGMRGVVSAGMTSAVEQLGLTDTFDEVHGASAGAFNGTFLLAGQAAYLAALYPHGFGNPAFVGLRQMLRGRPLFDMDYVVGEVWRRQRPLRVDAILSSGIELHCTATDIESAAIVDLTNLGDGDEIRCAMRASGRLPWLAGPPVEFRGRRWLDATLAEAIPIHAAQTTATDLLVLQTRPHGIQHTPLSGPIGRLTDRYLQTINPALVELRLTRSERYDRLSAELSARTNDASARPAVCVIRPPAGALFISQTENRQTALAIAGSHGFRAAWAALAGEDPELLSIQRAYPSAAAVTAAPPRDAEPASLTGRANA
ncbi:MAG: patatin-like phospholipase family protein [Solirubrobacteraceae bacterium]